MAIDMYRVHEAAARESAHAAYIGAPEFPALEEEAAKRGYRHAGLGEINASADAAHFAPDLHCWRGGLWVRIAA